MLTSRLPTFGENFFDLIPEVPTSRLQGLEMDMKETDDTFEALVNVPGIEKSDIDVSVEDDVLTVSVESHQKKEKEEDKEGYKYHWKERTFGKVSRSIRLPGHVDKDKIQAKTQDGVLHISLPKHKEDPRAVKRISIN